MRYNTFVRFNVLAEVFADSDSRLCFVHSNTRAYYTVGIAYQYIYN